MAYLIQLRDYVMANKRAVLIGCAIGLLLSMVF
jgi:hypothetical protein